MAMDGNYYVISLNLGITHRDYDYVVYVVYRRHSDVYEQIAPKQDILVNLKLNSKFKVERQT